MDDCIKLYKQYLIFGRLFATSEQINPVYNYLVEINQIFLTHQEKQDGYKKIEFKLAPIMMKNTKLLCIDDAKIQTIFDAAVKFLVNKTTLETYFSTLSQKNINVIDFENIIFAES